MKKSLATIFFLCVIFCLTAQATEPKEPAKPGTISTKAELDSLFIPTLPDWTDPYSKYNKGDMRYMNISDLMNRFDLERYQAVEVQNHYRDITRSDELGDRIIQFNKALKMVQNGNLESRIDLKKLASSPFIVVFDLDSTLYDQYGATAECNDIAYDLEPGKKKYIKLVPGWQSIFTTIKKHGGAIVIFSANLDDRVFKNMAHWTFNKQPLLEQGLIDGILTNSYLILQSKHEGTPVVIPSKDLRIVDPTLKKVIIVDDNPHLIFQKANARAFNKFDAEQYCTDDPILKKSYDFAMNEVSNELIESILSMEALKLSDFRTAYLPYTIEGKIVVEFLKQANQFTTEKANSFVRTHPDIVNIPK